MDCRAILYYGHARIQLLEHSVIAILSVELGLVGCSSGQHILSLLFYAG